MTALKMTVDEALALADDWIQGTTFHADSKGANAIMLVLATEVRRLRAAPGWPDGKGFYIASFKRTPGFVTWWRPDNAGYTPYLEQAGIYAADQIIADYHDAPDTVPVPVEFARRFVSRVVDIGHSGNKCWWSARDLRSALAAMEASNG